MKQIGQFLVHLLSLLNTSINHLRIVETEERKEEKKKKRKKKKNPMFISFHPLFLIIIHPFAFAL